MTNYEAIATVRRALNAAKAYDPYEHTGGDPKLYKPCHDSDCAVHNDPALPNGECNCGYAEDHEASIYDKALAALDTLSAAQVPDARPEWLTKDHAAWLADKIVALGDYAKEAAAVLRKWPEAAPQVSRDVDAFIEKLSVIDVKRINNNLTLTEWRTLARAYVAEYRESAIAAERERIMVTHVPHVIGDVGTCKICNKKCEPLAANPMLWPVRLLGKEGTTDCYHQGCIATERLASDRLREAVDWVLNDANYKAPEEIKDIAERWLQRLQAALAAHPEVGK